MPGVRRTVKHRSAARSAAGVAAAVVLGSALAVAGAGTAVAAPGSLTGTLYLTAGSCAHGSISGTYIQMILPSGSASGPYMSNSDSSCANQAYTLLSPGKDGGLAFGSYQPLPSPAFDSAGNAQAGAITAPAQYEGTAFATSTNPVDPQTHSKVAAPSLTLHGSQVIADVSSFSVSWNSQYFNQGSPKPDGSHPGITAPATGRYDASTGAMTLSWTSQVVGGPFDKFTGSWHLVGRFVPTAETSSGSRGTASSGSATTPSTAAATAPDATATASSAGKGQQAGAGSTAAPVAVSTSTGAPAVDSAASTSVITKHTWGVSWWLIALVIVVAAAGFGGLAALPRSGTDKPTDAS